MDWDGIGTLAFFFSSGAIGVGLITLRAYKARLASQLECDVFFAPKLPRRRCSSRFKNSRPKFNDSLNVPISQTVS